MRSRSDIVCWMLVAATGCVLPTRSGTPDGEQRRLREQVAALQTKVGELEGRLAALDKRVGSGPASKAAQRTLDQRLTGIEARLGLLGQDRQRERGAVAAETVAPRVPSPAPTPLIELDVDGIRRESARELPGGYRRGLELLSAGAYDEAIRALRGFVRAKHTSPFVPSAHYWIGQAYLQLGQSYQAVLAFTDVQQRSPRSEFAAAAGFASGVAFEQLGNVTEARRAFERVVSDYPDTPEAAKAATRLRR